MRRAGGSTGGAASAARSVGLTTRAAALGLVLCALVLSAALPLREYLSQRSRIHDLQQTQVASAARVQALEKQRALLDDPAYVASLARERLHYVAPGETTYLVLGLPPAPPATDGDAAAPPAGEAAPWWSQVWGSVRSADGAGSR